MTFFSKSGLLFFAFALAAQCDPVLSILDPAGVAFDPVPPTESVSLEQPGDRLPLVFLASGSSLSDPPSGPSDLYGFSYDVSFDPTQLQVVPNGITEDGYFAKNGLGLSPNVNNGTGLITNLNDFVPGPGPGENLSSSLPQSGADPLLTVEFQVVGTGTSNVTILSNSDLFFSDSNINLTTPLLGTEEVISQPLMGGTGPIPTPEPSTAQMLTLAGSLLLVVAQLLERNARPASSQPQA